MVFLLFSTLNHDDKDMKPIAFIPMFPGIGRNVPLARSGRS
jgi:hypothetical protein